MGCTPTGADARGGACGSFRQWASGSGWLEVSVVWTGEKINLEDGSKVDGIVRVKKWDSFSQKGARVAKQR